MLRAILLLSLIVLAAPALALTLDAPLTSAADEARAKALFVKIRCVVCQSESIADSPAEVAKDMRNEIRQQIAASRSDAEIITSLTGRYGDGILMQPPLNRSTAPLWFAPLLLLLLGGIVVWRHYKKSSTL